MGRITTSKWQGLVPPRSGAQKVHIEGATEIAEPFEMLPPNVACPPQRYVENLLDRWRRSERKYRQQYKQKYGRDPPKPPPSYIHNGPLPPEPYEGYFDRIFGGIMPTRSGGPAGPHNPYWFRNRADARLFYELHLEHHRRARDKNGKYTGRDNFGRFC